MKIKFSVASPLVGTMAVLIALGILSVPLRRLTQSEAISPQVIEVKSTDSRVHGVVRIKVLKKIDRVVFRGLNGEICFEMKDLEMGEHEKDCELRLEGEVLTGRVEVDFGAHEQESAIFVTVMPDGYEERTCYVIGAGEVGETIRLVWNHVENR